MDSRVFKKATLFAAISTTVQSIIWEVLSLVSLLAAVHVIKPSSDNKVIYKPSYGFGKDLLTCYFPEEINNNSCCGKLNMPQAGMLTISILYMLMSLVWLCVSVMLLADILGERKRISILTKIWGVVTITICALDFIVVILFGVDYGIMSTAKADNKYFDEAYFCKSSDLSLPGFLMSLAARGYLLWCINLATAIWLFKASITVVVSRRASLESENFDDQPWRSFDSRLKDQDKSFRSNKNAARSWSATPAAPHTPLGGWDNPRTPGLQRGGLAQRMGPHNQSFSYTSGMRGQTMPQSQSQPQSLGDLISQQRNSFQARKNSSRSWQQSQQDMVNPRWQQSGGPRDGSRGYENRGYNGGRGRAGY